MKLIHSILRLIPIIVLGSTVHTQANTDSPATTQSEAAGLARSIIIPKMDFREVPVEDAVAALESQIKRLAPLGKGVRIGVSNPRQDLRLTINFENVTALDAVSNIAILAKMELIESGDTLLLVPFSKSPRPLASKIDILSAAWWKSIPLNDPLRTTSTGTWRDTSPDSLLILKITWTGEAADASLFSQFLDELDPKFEISDGLRSVNVSIQKKCVWIFGERRGAIQLNLPKDEALKLNSGRAWKLIPSEAGGVEWSTAPGFAIPSMQP